MKRSMYDSIAVPRPQRNRFDFSHNRKMSFKMGGLYPTFWEPSIPGDSITISVQNMLRMAPMLAPVMDRIHVKTYSFYVPYRLLYPFWEKFMAENDAPGRVHPFATLASTPPVGSLGDYMGLPKDCPAGTEVNVFPFAAYELIYAEWFRNQYLNTDDFDDIILGDGDQIGNYAGIINGNVRFKCWNNDRYTAALPQAQRGTPVSLPLTTGVVPVELDTLNPAAWTVHDVNGGGPLGPPTGALIESGTNSEIKMDSQGASDRIMLNPNNTLYVDIQAEAVTINALREALALQRMLEIDNFGGARYTEIIEAHFGVKSPDARLQRPELIGYFSGVMSISEVLQTASSASAATDPTAPDAQPLGTMGGHGISVNGSERFGYYGTEHGLIMNLICVLPDTSYYQGLDKKWSHRLRTDYPFPSLANVGEVAVLNKEVYAQHTTPDGEWGYLPPYYEWKDVPGNTVAGHFKDTLEFWHTAREFTGDQDLNEDFVLANDVPNRFFAVQYTGGGPGSYTEDQIFGYIYHKITISRFLPYHVRPVI
jgi:hypothetical protein